MDLNLITLFVEIVECRGLAAAARKLDMSKSNISQRLKVLERETGAQLVRRSARSFELTEAGQVLYTSGRRMLDDLDNARASIDMLGQTLTGRIRISVPTGVGRLFVGPKLREFARIHPGISLAITFNNRIEDLIASEVDIALRIERAPPLDCVAREVCSIDWILCASADYFQRRGPINHPADLASQTFIGLPPSLETTIELRNRNDDTDAQLVHIQPTLQSPDYPFILDAVLEGMGIGILPIYAIRGSTAKNLQQVLPQYRIVGQLNSLYILTLPSRFPSPAKRALIEYLEKELREYAESWK
ncbi:LysR family transcriptional regulator [Pseudomonas sp. LB3P14]